MATIRKRLGKWQVQIRRHNYPQIIKSFKEKSIIKLATKFPPIKTPAPQTRILFPVFLFS